MKRTLILMGAFVLVVGLPTTRGQSPSIKPNILNATGGTKLIGTTEFDWSVGEMTMVSTFYGPKDANIIVTQGLLQNELSTPVKVANTNFGQHLQVFPNPSSSIVNVQFFANAAGTLQYRLMDMAGKVILENSSTVKEGANMAQINIAGVAAATYLLEVSLKDDNNNEASTSYKIEKLN